MSFRNRRLAKESFAEAGEVAVGDESDIIEGSLIDSDISDAEVDGHFDEGDILISDTDVVEKLDEKVTDDPGAMNTTILAVEAIARRWEIKPNRKLSRESMVPYTGDGKFAANDDESGDSKDDAKKGFKQFIMDLWDRFLEWVDGLLTSIGQGFKNLFSAARDFEKAAAKYEKRLKSLGDVKEGAESIVMGVGNVRVLSIDNTVNPNPFTGGLVNEINTMQKDMAEWMAGNLDVAKFYIGLSVDGSDVKRIDGKHKGDIKRMTSPNGFFKATEKMLKRFGPEGSDEKQFMIPLINNDFIQVFNYDTEYQAADMKLPYSICGMRFISAPFEFNRNEVTLIESALNGGRGGALSGGIKFNNIMSIAEMIKVNQNLGELAKGMRTIEKSYTKVMNDVSDLKKEAKQRLAESKDKDINVYGRATAAIANRVAREAVMSTQASYRATSSITKNTARACNVLLAANIKCYDQAA